MGVEQKSTCFQCCSEQVLEPRGCPCSELSTRQLRRPAHSMCAKKHLCLQSKVAFCAKAVVCLGSLLEGSLATPNRKPGRGTPIESQRRPRSRSGSRSNGHSLLLNRHMVNWVDRKTRSGVGRWTLSTTVACALI